MGVKKILMIARDNKIEALRMATGLTLLDDVVKVLVCGELEESAEADEQLEALDFSDVPVIKVVNQGDIAGAMAEEISQADTVFII